MCKMAAKTTIQFHKMGLSSSVVPPIINRKVAAAMIALSIYGLLLIVISNNNININPVYVLTNIKNRYYVYNNASNTPTTHISPRFFDLETKAKATSMATDKAHNTTAVKYSTITNISTNQDSEHSIPMVTTTKLTTSSTNQHSNNMSMGPLPVLQNIVLPSVLGSTEHTWSADAKPIITMFTTFKNSPNKEHIYKNTIRNWERLKPWVIPVLYYLPGETGLLDYAKKHGWETKQVPKISRAKVPILRHMFLHAENKHKTYFYCYTNGDILFETGLIETLKTLEPVTAKMKQVLVVGRRTNFKLDLNENVDSFNDIKNFGKTGQLFGTNAQDYFITTRHGYPWNNIPDFVVGRVGYDNWLVVTAIVKKMVVIDTTKTILALHQTGKDGNFAGHSKKSTGDTYINYNLAGKRFDYSLGHVTCGQFFTNWTLTPSGEEKVKIMERQKNGCEMKFKRHKLSPYIHLPKRR